MSPVMPLVRNGIFYRVEFRWGFQTWVPARREVLERLGSQDRPIVVEAIFLRGNDSDDEDSEEEEHREEDNDDESSGEEATKAQSGGAGSG